MTESKSKLHSLLFEEGRKLENIKFFPGDSRGLTAGQMMDAAAESIRRAFDSGLVSVPPSTNAAKCKLEAFN